jgi:NlpC/P60 family
MLGLVLAAALTGASLVAAPAATAADHGSVAGDGTTLAQSVYQNAEADLGSYPYSWAGGHGADPGPTYGECDSAGCSGETTLGFDCSGFTRWVYYQASGRDLLGPGNTNSQLAETTQTSSPVPGDLVFFGASTTNTEHVGIYIGNGQMINAYETGTRIEVNNVSDGGHLLGYWHYASAAPAAGQSSPVVVYGTQMQVYGPTSSGAVDSDVYTPGKTWSGWQSLGGDLVGRPTAVQYGGQMQVFGRTSAGATESDVYTSSLGKWSGWQSIGGNIVSDPVAIEYSTSQYGNQMEVYGRAADGSVWSDVYTLGSAKWSGWYSLGGDLAGSLSVVQYGSQMQVFGRTSGGAVESDVYSSGTGKWSGWQNIGGNLAGDPTAIEYDTQQFGAQMQVYGPAADGSVWSDVYSEKTGKWSGWTSIGGDCAGEPSVTTYGTQMEVFGRTPDGAVESDVYTPSVGKWSGWMSLGGNIAGDPTAIEYNTSQYGDQMQVYGRAAGGALWSDVYSPGSGKWSGWTSLGGDLT